MKRVFYKKKVLLLAGLLFIASGSLDALYHVHSDGESSQIRCQFCKNETPDPAESEIFISRFVLSKVTTLEIKEKLFSPRPKAFLSRAPPNI